MQPTNRNWLNLQTRITKASCDSTLTKCVKPGLGSVLVQPQIIASHPDRVDHWCENLVNSGSDGPINETRDPFCYRLIKMLVWIDEIVRGIVIWLQTERTRKTETTGRNETKARRRDQSALLLTDKASPSCIQSKVIGTDREFWLSTFKPENLLSKPSKYRYDCSVTKTLGESTLRLLDWPCRHGREAPFPSETIIFKKSQKSAKKDVQNRGPRDTDATA